MLDSGGMPSSHSATVTALAVAIGLQEGTGASSFAIAVVLACVVSQVLFHLLFMLFFFSPSFGKLTCFIFANCPEWPYCQCHDLLRSNHSTGFSLLIFCLDFDEFLTLLPCPCSRNMDYSFITVNVCNRNPEILHLRKLFWKDTAS